MVAQLSLSFSLCLTHMACFPIHNGYRQAGLGDAIALPLRASWALQTNSDQFLSFWVQTQEGAVSKFQRTQQ